jgi:hypothetical protein
MWRDNDTPYPPRNCPELSQTTPKSAPELTDFQEKPFHSFQGLTESDFCAVVGRSLKTRLCVARATMKTLKFAYFDLLCKGEMAVSTTTNNLK